MASTGLRAHVDKHFEELLIESNLPSPKSSSEEEIVSSMSEDEDSSLLHCFFSDVPDVLPEVSFGTNLENEDSFSSFIRGEDADFMGELISSKWLSTHYSTIVPAAIVKWLFNMVSFSNNERLRISAFNTLHTFLTGFASGFSTEIVDQSDYIPPLEWIPDAEVFIKAFGTLGCNFSTALDESRHMIPRREFEERNRPYYQNVKYLVKVLSLCIRQSPQTYDRDGILTLMFGLFRMSLDEDISSILDVIQSSIGASLEWFDNIAWETEILVVICETLTSQRFFSTFAHSEKLFRILPPVFRGDQFRSCFCCHLLTRLILMDRSLASMISPATPPKAFEFKIFTPLLLGFSDFENFDVTYQILEIIVDRICYFLSLPMIATKSYKNSHSIRNSVDHVYFEAEKEAIILIEGFYKKCISAFRRKKREENGLDGIDFSDLDLQIEMLYIEVGLIQNEIIILKKL